MGYQPSLPAPFRYYDGERLFGYEINAENAPVIARKLFGFFDDYKFLEFKNHNNAPVLAFDARLVGTPLYGLMWQHEFARRFYLRPLEAKPNTQDGTTLVRAI